MSNGAAMDYTCFVATTTGYFGVENAAGEVFVHRAGVSQDIPASGALALWSCAGSCDPTPSGDITALDCHDLGLTLLDVRGLAPLKTLDCSGNFLTELDLSGLIALENLYALGNPFVSLDLSPCRSMNFVGYASRYLGYCDSAMPCLHDGPPLSFRPKIPNGILDTANDTLCAEKYVSPRTRTITTEEAEIRAIAYALKDGNPDAIAVAAPAMAELIEGPCWLVPIPASDTTLGANLSLARAIAANVPGARVKLAIERTKPVESSTKRRQRGRYGLEPNEHQFVRTGGPLNPLPLYFVDNVTTTGNTFRAARAVLGWGTGLAYADASSPFNSRQKQMTGTRLEAEIEL